MNVQEELFGYLAKYVDVEKGDTVYQAFDVEEMSLLQMRDLLFSVGRIVEGNIENSVYVIAVDRGKSAFSKACIVLKKIENTIYCVSYAIEGLIKQNIAQNNVDLVIKCLKSKKKLKRNNKRIPYYLGMILIATLICVGLLQCRHKPAQIIKDDKQTENEKTDQESAVDHTEQNDEPIVDDLREKYLNAVSNYNTLAKAYNELVVSLDISNITDMPQRIEPKRSEVSESELTEESIQSVINDLEELLVEYKIINSLSEPTEKWIVSRLETLNDIGKVETVTKNNDPDGLLGKENSYYSCIYFSLKKIDQSKIPGKSVIDKGTDCGGAVELYDTVEKARNRCDYLGQFDNTLLYTGSYTIFGKMVIRTSYALSNEDQIETTKEIVSALLSE